MHVPINVNLPAIFCFLRYSLLWAPPNKDLMKYHDMKMWELLRSADTNKPKLRGQVICPRVSCAETTQ
ncbi:hypothetical protein PGTUg99_005151 [Puccinia graminis f. sp. tritici]|uniref:Uncharacterized protein n=1 Tax=Puccinia graminis f. sp. tritici TaxID=56615 RepID=A0A5B0SE25_PUCGR|nr:hypothetical protein PGTUg99_005151 [Puccinia graminis f. sp. tritici]